MKGSGRGARTTSSESGGLVSNVNEENQPYHGNGGGVRGALLGSQLRIENSYLLCVSGSWELHRCVKNQSAVEQYCADLNTLRCSTRSTYTCARMEEYLGRSAAVVEICTCNEKTCVKTASSTGAEEMMSACRLEPQGVEINLSARLT